MSSQTKTSERGLSCPDPNCDKRFHTYHDEHRMSTFVGHLRLKHPTVYRNLRRKLGLPVGDGDE